MTQLAVRLAFAVLLVLLVRSPRAAPTPPPTVH